MDVLIVIVALALVAGLASAMHGFIKPAVDWMYPPPPEPAPPVSGTAAPGRNALDAVLLLLLGSGLVGGVLMAFMWVLGWL